jgi:hypothetical protein
VVSTLEVAEPVEHSGHVRSSSSGVADGQHLCTCVLAATAADHCGARRGRKNGRLASVTIGLIACPARPLQLHVYVQRVYLGIWENAPSALLNLVMVNGEVPMSMVA